MLQEELRNRVRLSAPGMSPSLLIGINWGPFPGTDANSALIFHKKMPPDALRGHSVTRQGLEPRTR